MGQEQNWRQQISAEDYFTRQGKQSQVEHRRPVIRKASDLVGPGIGAQAVVLTDWNDTLALYNGYFSSVRALHGAAPQTSGPDVNYDTNSYVGYVISDSTLAVRQVKTNVATGVTYTRVGVRTSGDAETITWPNEWTSDEPPKTPMVQALTAVTTTVPNGIFTAITPPTKTRGSNDASYYSRAGSGWQILKPGLYLVDVQCGNTSGVAMRARVQVGSTQFPEPAGSPHEEAPRRVEHATVTASDLVGGSASIFVEVRQDTGSSVSTISHQLRVSRIGEA